MSSHEDVSSPFHYPGSQTALLLLDFQNFTIKICGTTGEAALDKAVHLRRWALSKDILVVHSIVNVEGVVPPHIKSKARIENMLADVKADPDAAKEPDTLAASEGEHIVLKQPGVVSGLKSDGCEKLLKDHGIKSLITCGLSTSGAVLRTAMPASDEGFVVSVVKDACADRTVELHETIMEKVLPSRAHVFGLEELVSEWEEEK